MKRWDKTTIGKRRQWLKRCEMGWIDFKRKMGTEKNKNERKETGLYRRMTRMLLVRAVVTHPIFICGHPTCLLCRVCLGTVCTRHSFSAFLALERVHNVIFFVLFFFTADVLVAKSNTPAALHSNATAGGLAFFMVLLGTALGAVALFAYGYYQARKANRV